MITWTSEMSGSASSGMRRIAQIPASTRERVAAKTRNRFRAHQSIQRPIMSHAPPRRRGWAYAGSLHPSLYCDRHLLLGDGLTVFGCQHGDLPCPARLYLPGALINAAAFLAERDHVPHCSHSHSGHGRHKKGNGYLSSCDRLAIRTGELHAEGVRAWMRDRGSGRVFEMNLILLGARARCTYAWRRRSEGAHSRLKLTLRVDQEIGGGHDALTRFRAFQTDNFSSWPGANRDIARLKTASSPVDGCDLACSGVKHTRSGNDRLPAEWNVEPDIDEHPERQFRVRILYLQTNFRRTSRRIQLRPDEAHAPAEYTSWIGIHADLSGASDLHASEIVLKDFRVNPYRGEIRQRI